MVAPADELSLCRRLLDTSMITLLPEAEVARRPDGRLFINGCFGVDHRKGMRAIFDLRASNAGEHRIRWSCLPAGVMTCWIQLKRGEALRGSGDDLSNWFYQLQETPGMIPRRAFGRSIPEEVAWSLGACRPGPHRMALKVLGMGSLNAPDIAQLAHESI